MNVYDGAVGDTVTWANPLLVFAVAALLTGFHTFDYARHFLSCCTRLLGLNHKTERGALVMDYYGRTVGVKICPTGVNTDRLQDGVMWNDSIHARAAFRQVFQGRKVFLGVDDFDVFKVGRHGARGATSPATPCT